MLSMLICLNPTCMNSQLAGKMQVRKMTSRRRMSTCSISVMLAILYFVAIDMRGVSALITGEPYAIYDDTHNNVPLPPDSGDVNQSGCIPLLNNGERAYDVFSSCPFVIKKPRTVFRTDVGEFKVVILDEEHLMQRRKMAVGLLTLEPNALLLPQYLNGPSVFYVHRGISRYNLLIFTYF